MKTTLAVFEKEWKDILKNMTVLILYIVYPVIAIIMTQAMNGEPGVEANFFISVFATMHVIFTPIVATAFIIVEEKEKNTLRVLIMSNVRSGEYLLGIGSCVWICTMVSGVLFLAAGSFTGSEAVKLMLSMAVASIGSILLGMGIGAVAKNTAQVNGLSLPVAFLFAFTPMLAGFSEPIAKYTKILYGQQISKWISGAEFSMESICIVAANFVVFAVFFLLVYRRNRLDA